MAGVLETRLIIGATDNTGAAFASVESRVKKLSSMVAGASKAVGTSSGNIASASAAGQAMRNAGFGMGAVAGAARAAAGYALAIGGGMAVHEAIKAVGARQHELVRMAISGMKPEEIADASVEAAKLNAKMPAVGLTETLHMLRNARSIVGTYQEAAEIAEPLMKLRVLAQLARPGQDVSEDFDQLIKGLEIKGVTQNPEQFRQYMEGIAKGINVFGDTLKPYQYYEMFKYGRQATAGLSEKFILGTAPTLAQELGGSSYGKAVSAFNSLIVGGIGKKGAFEEMARLGLIEKDDLAKNMPGTGTGSGLKAGRTVKGWKVAQEDPNAWVRDYLLPALDKLGIKDRADVMRELSTLFQNQTASQMVSLLATQQSRIDKDLALLQGAPGLAGAERAMREDPSLAWQGLKSAIEGLTSQLGESLKLAGAMTDVALEISRFTAGLGIETDAQNRGKPSPGVAAQQRLMNRLMFGVDTDDIEYARRVSGRRGEDSGYGSRVHGFVTRADELREAIGYDDDVIAHGAGGDAAVQRAYEDRDRARAEMDRLRAAASAAKLEWDQAVGKRGKEDRDDDLRSNLDARKAGRDGMVSIGTGTRGEADYIEGARKAAEGRAFGEQTVKLEGKADVDVKVTVEATDALLHAIASVQAAAEGALAVHVGRMGGDAGPRRAGPTGPRSS